MRIVPLVLTLLLLGVSAGAGAIDRTRPWHDSSVGIISRLSLEQVRTAIHTGAADRKWTITVDQPGHMELVVAPRQHVLKVALDYDASRYSVRYLDSSNLDHREEGGRRMVHGSALTWVDNLIAAINIQLLRAQPQE